MEHSKYPFFDGWLVKMLQLCALVLATPGGCPSGLYRSHSAAPCGPLPSCLPAPFDIALMATRPPDCPSGSAAQACKRTAHAGGADDDAPSHIPTQWWCVQCAAGRFTNASTASGGAGGIGVVAEGEEPCVQCPTGQYQSQPGQARCKLCRRDARAVVPEHRASTLSNAGNRVAVGFAVAEGGRACLPTCPPGRFVSLRGTGDDGSDDDGGNGSGGSGSNVGGMTGNEYSGAECRRCAWGRFATAHAPGGGVVRHCEKCVCTRPGQYSASLSSCTCTMCTPGRYLHAPSPGGTTGGRHQRRAAPCIECPAGQHQPRPGQVTCNRCSKGAVALEPGATHCAACAKGRFAPLQNYVSRVVVAIPCQPCPSGQFGIVTGRGTGNFTTRREPGCMRCPIGKYAGDTGQLKCVRCPCGKFTAFSRTVCTTVGEAGQGMTIGRNSEGHALTQIGCEQRLKQRWERAGAVQRAARLRAQRKVRHAMEQVDAVLANQQHEREREYDALLQQQKEQRQRRVAAEERKQHALLQREQRRETLAAALRRATRLKQLVGWRSVLWGLLICTALVVPLAVVARCCRYGLHRNIMHSASARWSEAKQGLWQGIPTTQRDIDETRNANGMKVEFEFQYQSHAGGAHSRESTYDP